MGALGLGLLIVVAASHPLKVRVPPERSSLPRVQAASRDLHVVQLRRAAKPEDAAWLQAAGATPLQTVPLHAWLCRMDGDQAAVVALRPDVARVERLAPGARVHEALHHPFSTLLVRLRPAPDADVDALAARAQALGAEPIAHVPLRRAAPVVRATPLQVAALAADPEVLLVEPYLPVRPLMSVARTSATVPAGRGPLDGPMLDVERVWAMGLRGEAQVVAVADTGLDTGTFTGSPGVPPLHDDFGRLGDASNPLRAAVVTPGDLEPGLPETWHDEYDHGTSVAAQAVGNGAMSGADVAAGDYAGSHAGMAPRARLVAECIFYSEGGIPRATFGTSISDDLIGLASRLGASVHSTSMGGGVDYDWTARGWDQAAWEHPDMLLVAGAGNSGADGRRAPWESGWDATACGAGWELTDAMSPDASGACTLISPGAPFWSANARACRSPYGPAVSSCLLSPPFDVDPARPPVRLVLTHEADIAPDGDEGVVDLDADDDGTFETLLLRVTGRVPYREQAVVMPPAPWGTTARLRFRFLTNASGGAAGWNVHFVELRDGRIDPGSLLSPAVAKNIVTVGASENVRPGQRQDVSSLGDCADDGTYGPAWFEEPAASDHAADHGFGVTPWSSRGPTRDGRVKPDLCAPGTFTLTARSRAATGVLAGCGIDPAQVANHEWFGGTSGAAPIVAGAAALVRQAFQEGRITHGRIDVGAPDTDRAWSPTGALLKAVLLDAGTDMAPGEHDDVPAARPNAVSGHGRLDVLAAIDPSQAFGADRRTRRLLLDERAGLRTGEAREHAVAVVSPDVPLRATLAWTDPPPSDVATAQLVNDLDAEIRFADGSTRAFDADPAAPVNSLTLPAGSFPAGPAVVTVRGVDVPGQLGYARSEIQAYALVVSGALACAEPAPVAGTLRVRADAAAGDVVLSWEAGSDFVSYAVADVDESAAFATRTVLSEGAPPAFTHAGALRDGALRCYLVAGRSRCGALSAWD